MNYNNDLCAMCWCWYEVLQRETNWTSHHQTRSLMYICRRDIERVRERENEWEKKTFIANAKYRDRRIGVATIVVYLQRRSIPSIRISMRPFPNSHCIWVCDVCVWESVCAVEMGWHRQTRVCGYLTKMKMRISKREELMGSCRSIVSSPADRTLDKRLQCLDLVRFCTVPRSLMHILKLSLITTVDECVHGPHSIYIVYIHNMRWDFICREMSRLNCVHSNLYKMHDVCMLVCVFRGPYQFSAMSGWLILFLSGHIYIPYECLPFFFSQSSRFGCTIHEIVEKNAHPIYGHAFLLLAHFF